MLGVRWLSLKKSSISAKFIIKSVAIIKKGKLGPKYFPLSGLEKNPPMETELIKLNPPNVASKLKFLARSILSWLMSTKEARHMVRFPAKNPLNILLKNSSFTEWVSIAIPIQMYPIIDPKIERIKAFFRPI